MLAVCKLSFCSQSQTEWCATLCEHCFQSILIILLWIFCPWETRQLTSRKRWLARKEWKDFARTLTTKRWKCRKMWERRERRWIMNQPVRCVCLTGMAENECTDKDWGQLKLGRSTSAPTEGGRICRRRTSIKLYLRQNPGKEPCASPRSSKRAKTKSWMTI